MNKFDSVLPLLLSFVEELKTNKGEKIELVNQITKKNYTLLSKADLDDANIPKKSVMPLDQYFKEVLIAAAEKRIESHQIVKHFNDFKMRIANYHDEINQILANLMKKINKGNPVEFVENFLNGILYERDEFQESLQLVISDLAREEQNMNDHFLNVEQSLKGFYKNYEVLKQELNNQISKIHTEFPSSIEKTNTFIINESKKIPYFNGIDIHPSKKMLVASTNGGGDMVFYDIGSEKEILREKMENNSNGNNVDNYLWSPSGKSLLVVTCNPSWIYIYNEEGIKKHSINIFNNYLTTCGSAWINERTVAVGYWNGSLKIYDIDVLTEIGSSKISSECISAMNCYDEEFVLAGDYGGTLRKVHWKNLTEAWSKKIHEQSKFFCMIRVSKDKLKILTCSDDYYVKCISALDVCVLWEFKLVSQAICISLHFPEVAVFAVAWKMKQLVLLDLETGKILFEVKGFKDFPEECRSLRIDHISDNMFIGDTQGKIHQYKLIYQATE